VRGIDICHFFAVDLNARMRFNGTGHFRREDIAIHREGLTAGYARDGGGAKSQRIQTPQFFFKKPGRGRMLIAFQGITANELGQTIGLMRVRRSHGPHLVKHNIDAPFRKLPRGFCTSQTAACD
jgi:hypothetical protein